MNKALEKQIAGTHYKTMTVQPIEFIAHLGLNFFQGNIVKYISRAKDSTDIDKAIHYCELAIELGDKEVLPMQGEMASMYMDTILKYVENNNLQPLTDLIIYFAFFKKYNNCKILIEKYKKNKTK